MKLYNSYSLKVEEFVPIKKGEVSMYVCGPTVYNHPHIGNARPIAIFDMLRRVLESQNLKVKFVSNFTIAYRYFNSHTIISRKENKQ